MKRKFKKHLLSLVLTLGLSLCMGATAFAAEDESTTTDEVVETAVQEDEPQAASARSASGYAAHYTDTFVDSFYVTVSGSSSASGTAKLKAWDCPSDVDVYVTLYRPDGSTAFASVKLPIGQEISKSFSNFQTGTYRISYRVYGSYKLWIYGSLFS